MYNPIYFNSNSEFLKVVEQLSQKLTFNTRDEYLVWVKQWKEDYKNISNAIRNQRLVWKHKSAVQPERITYFKARLDKSTAVPAEFHESRITILNNQLFADTGVRGYCSWSLIAIYLLTLRKAGKIRAQRCYQTRKAQEVVL